jgi:hypothetical protein
LRREHDDESGNAGHDDTGKRHGRRGNAGRIASSIGLLTGKTRFPTSSRKTADASDAARRRPRAARRF